MGPNSEGIVDAIKDMTITITEEDRTNAVCGDRHHCVIANAVRRYRGVLDVRVGATSARVLRRDGWHRYILPPTEVANVYAFDAMGQKMPPGTKVHLLAPKPHQRLGARSGSKPGSNRRSGKRTSVATRRQSTRHVYVNVAS